MAKKKPVVQYTEQNATVGDCVKLLRQIKVKPKLIVADPPYNFGQEYDAYDDKKSRDEYMNWTMEWLHEAHKLLDPHGSMWIFAPDEWVSEIDVHCRHDLGMYKRRHVVWGFTFGQRAQKNFTRSHCHILYLTKSKTKFTFNEHAVMVPSARQLVYNDRRANASGKVPDATWMLLKDQLEEYMTPDRDTWLVSRICGTYKERQKHSPNQIPVPIMERIVLSCTDPKDFVVDPFAGTGSSGVACAMHDRDWEGMDVSEKCVTAIEKRIKETLEGMKK